MSETINPHKRPHDGKDADQATQQGAKRQRTKQSKKQLQAEMVAKYSTTPCPDPCPLCGKSDPKFLCYNFARPYYHCQRCTMIYIPTEFRLNMQEEKQVYTRHENDKDDPGFLKFLSQIVDPLVVALNARSSKPVEDKTAATTEGEQTTAEEQTTTTTDSTTTTETTTTVDNVLVSEICKYSYTAEELSAEKQVGLDFGSGPHTAVNAVLQTTPYSVVAYDPYFHPAPALPASYPVYPTVPPEVADLCTRHADLVTKTSAYDGFLENYASLPEGLKTQYPFLVCSEVLKHVRNPLACWMHMYSLLQPGGVLAILGGICHDKEKFESWSYARDNTHIVFYCKETFEFVEKLFPWTLVWDPTHTKICYFVKPK